LEIASRHRIRKIGRIDVVLERERHPVHRAEPLAALTPPRSANCASAVCSPLRTASAAPLAPSSNNATISWPSV